MPTHKVKAAVAASIISAIMLCTAGDPLAAGAWSGDSYKSWRQQDPAWSSLCLGDSDDTVGKSGCTVTAAAMLMVKSGSVTDPGFTPAKLVSFMTSCGGFGPTGNLDLNKLSHYARSFRYCQRFALSGTREQKAEEMQRLMDEGYYLMAVVKYGQHYVAIDSVNGSEVRMMDPANSAVKLFDVYAAEGVTALRLFRGANSRSDYMDEEKAATPPAPTDLTTTTPPAAEPAETMEAPAFEELTPETPPFDDLTPETPPAPEEPAAETAPAPTETAAAATAAETTAATETETKAAEPERETTAAEETPETPPMPEDEETDAEADTPPTPPMPADEPQAAPDSIKVLFKLGSQRLLMKVHLTAANDLVLYAAPDQDAEHLLVIPADGELDITEADGQLRWGKAAYAGKTGWIDLTAAGL